jgi:succinate-semialdehyde dehydrogenase/glutarate-semialdehyde dehydrogenase
VTAARLDGLADRVHAPAGRAADEALAVEAPFTGDPIGRVPAGTPADVREAVAASRRAAGEWADRSVAERAALLDRVGDRVLERSIRRELLDVLQLETGKTRTDALEEVLDIANTAHHYAAVVPDILAPDRHAGAVPGLTRTVERAHPRGVVGVILPWNYPLTLALSDTLPALAAGNGVVFKPAESTPYTALRAVELLEACGVPSDLVGVVTGDGPTLGEPLIEAADFVQFTGSTAVGRDVAAAAGRHLTPTSLELGGKNPAVVLDDVLEGDGLLGGVGPSRGVDLETAARGVAAGAFANAGQLCVSTERAYVEADAFEPFLTALVRRTRSLQVGASYGYGPDVGTLASAAQLDRVETAVDEAVDAGATLLTGGRRRPDVGPYAYEPTVLTDVPTEVPLATEETFGPVVAVTSVADADAAVARANDTPYGLHASVWTGTPARGERVATRLEAGTVGVNDAYRAVWASSAAPMGGWDDSGLGRRHGRDGLLKYTDAQSISTQRGGPLVDPDADWLRGPLMERAAVGLVRARDWFRRREWTP